MKTTPLYLQIRSYIMSLVRKSNGRMERIPSVRELCKMFDSTNVTVQKAMKSMIEEGILLPKRGMGTYISPDWQNRFIRQRKGVKNIGIVIGYGGMIYYYWTEWQLINRVCSMITDRGDSVEFINFDSTGAEAAESIMQYDLSGLVWINLPLRHSDTIEALQSNSLPVVTVNSPFQFEGLVGASIDYYKLGRLAADYFLKRDEAEVAYATIHRSGDSQCRILQGFLDAYQHSKFDFNEKYLLKDNNKLDSNIHQLIMKKGCRNFFIKSSKTGYFGELISTLPPEIVKELTVVSEYMPQSVATLECGNIAFINRDFAKVAQSGTEKLYKLLSGNKVKQNLELITPDWHKQ